MDYGQLKGCLERSLKSLLDIDRDLFDIKVNERSVTHRLGHWLQLEIPAWSVDCEYNKIGDDAPKRLGYDPARLAQFGKDPMSLAYPDVIVHQRRDPVGNLAVLEAKWYDEDPNEIAFDKYKLSLYRSPDLFYSYAFAVIFNHGKHLPLKAEVIVIERNEAVRETFPVEVPRQTQQAHI